MLRIAYFGTAQFAVPPLLALLKEPGRFEVVAVVSQPDKPAGRSGELTTTPVAQAARVAGVRLLQPAKMKTDETREMLAALQADVFIVAAYGRIIPRAILDLPPKGCLNLHGSLLPKYRGASPIQASIVGGETVTGVTLIGMDEEVDHGPTYATSQVPVEAGDTYTSLEAKLATAAAALLIDKLEDVVSGALPPVEQDHTLATHTGIIDKREGFVRWTDSTAAEIERKLRAYTPWPGIYAIWKRGTGEEARPLRLKLLEVKAIDNPQAVLPGKTFLDPESGEPAVAAREGAIVLRQVQPEGKKPLPGKVFLNGYQDFIGASLESAE